MRSDEWKIVFCGLLMFLALIVGIAVVFSSEDPMSAYCKAKGFDHYVARPGPDYCYKVIDGSLSQFYFDTDFWGNPQ